MGVDAELYLLDIRAFLEDGARGGLIEEALSRLDGERREKARRIGQARGQAASLGAGLLLQLAVRRAESVKEAVRAGKSGAVQDTECAGQAEPGQDTESARETGVALTQWTVPGLLESLDAPLPLVYRYRENGKPYLVNYPYYFNISHSGDYVVCALSEREVGVDLQIHRGANIGRLAGRFFAPAEADALGRAADREAFFFRLWARKEAYGKLTGKGLADAIGKDLHSGGTGLGGMLCWEEYGGLPGYSMAVCQYAAGVHDPSGMAH